MDPGGMRYCTTCGSQRTGTHSFCTVCGAEFRDLVRPGPPAAAAEPVAGPAAPDPDQDHPDVTFMEPGGSPETMPTQAELHVAEPPYARSAHMGPAPIEPSAGGPGRPDGGSYPGSTAYPRPISRPPGRRNKIILMGAVAVDNARRRGRRVCPSGRSWPREGIERAEASSERRCQPCGACIYGTDISGTDHGCPGLADGEQRNHGRGRARCGRQPGRAAG